MTAGPVNSSMLITPPGAGAIAVVRVTGPDALQIVDQVFRAGNGLAFSAQPVDRVVYGRFVASGETIDEVLVSRVPESDPPAVDLCAHGGVRIVERVLQALESAGAQMRPGLIENTGVWKAANLIEQEAVDALCQAKTSRAVRFLARQQANLVPALEDIAALFRTDPEQAAADELRTMLRGVRAARTLIEGATVAIVGPPNSGKSTLFNQLVGKTAALVSPHAGTTRDWVAQPVEMSGVPVVLVDTAGRHQPGGVLEAQAIERGLGASAEARVRLIVLDRSQPVDPGVAELTGPRRSGSDCLIVINKGDLKRVWDVSTLPAELAKLSADRIELSALTGAGVDLLVERIVQLLGFEGWVDTQPHLFTIRQHEVVTRLLAEEAGGFARALWHMDRLIGGVVRGNAQ